MDEPGPLAARWRLRRGRWNRRSLTGVEFSIANLESNDALLEEFVRGKGCVCRQRMLRPAAPVMKLQQPDQGEKKENGTGSVEVLGLLGACWYLLLPFVRACAGVFLSRGRCRRRSTTRRNGLYLKAGSSGLDRGWSSPVTNLSYAPELISTCTLLLLPDLCELDLSFFVSCPMFHCPPVTGSRRIMVTLNPWGVANTSSELAELLSRG